MRLQDAFGPLPEGELADGSCKFVTACWQGKAGTIAVRFTMFYGGSRHLPFAAVLLA